MGSDTRPVHIITGFLGAGKTTLLNRLLERPEYANTLVIVNEFGEISLDHLLIKTGEETIFELSNGCVCCSMRSELVETLFSLDTARFERVIIETTGIADPLPVLQSLSVFEVRQRGFVPGVVVTVFPVPNGLALLDQHEEARHQLALADLVCLSQVPEAGVPGDVSQAVSALNANAPVMTDPGKIHLDIPGRPDTTLPTRQGSHQSARYKSVVLCSDRALPLRDLVGFQHLLASTCGQSLLRLKGFAIAEDVTEPVLLQMSGQIVHEPETGKAPDTAKGDQPVSETRFVVILKDGDPAAVGRLFDGFFGTPHADTADRDALMNNPLAIPGI